MFLRTIRLFVLLTIFVVAPAIAKGESIPTVQRVRIGDVATIPNGIVTSPQVISYELPIYLARRSRNQKPSQKNKKCGISSLARRSRNQKPSQKNKKCGISSTEEALTQGIGGTVTVEARIDINGVAKVSRVIKGLGFGLDERAIVAASLWRFLPAQKNGTPVELIAQIDVDFSLGNQRLIERDLPAEGDK